jgi:glycosyltransferase involved in cell wall biosynthesis
MRRIGIDGRSLESGIAGIGRYVGELCQVLDRELPEAEFFVYSRVPLRRGLFSGRWHFRVEPVPAFRRLKGSLWLKLRCGTLARGDSLDVFWGPSTLLPPLANGVKKVVTVHDLNHLVAPETMGVANLWAHRLFFAADVRRADVALANSEGTALRLRERIGRAADGVIVPGVGAAFTVLRREELDSVLLRYGVTRPYHLTVATWEPRKNLETLVRTHAEMKRTGELPRHSLVLAGGKGWKDRRLTRLVSGIEPGDVVPLGYVPDEDLPPLYAGADAFLFPSIYEGFGIPLLEARACGTLVVATDIPELRESGGEGGIYIEPTPAGIRQGILASLSPRPRVAESLPSWDEGGAKLAEVFRT